MQSALKKPQEKIKKIQSEHYSKLLAKQNSEGELLEDLRSFCKQRALIDKEYGQSLQKICNSFLSKKEFLALQNPPEDWNRSVWDVWKSFLKTFNQLAISRIKSAEEHHRLSLELKPLKCTRGCISKRTFKQLKALHNDLCQSAQEMIKSQKIYSEEEKQAHESRTKAISAEEKLKRRSTNLFSSMAQLHRNHAELSLRRKDCENRSTSARNEYLFQLTAFNAHLEHYIKTDVPELAQILDGDVYEKFREVFSSTSQIELDICKLHQEPFQLLLSESATINRSKAWDQFIKESTVFSDEVQFQFETRYDDAIRVPLSVPSREEGGFDQIAKKLARRFVMRERCIKSFQEEINNLRAGRSTPPLGVETILGNDYDNSNEGNTLNQEYVEHKVEELEFAIRRQEIEKKKIDACLDLLKASTVDVKSALVEAYLEAVSFATVQQQQQRSHDEGTGSQRGSMFGGLSSTTATGSSSTEGSIAGVATSHADGGKMLDTESTSGSHECGGGVSKKYNSRRSYTNEQLANEAWTLASANRQRDALDPDKTFNGQNDDNNILNGDDEKLHRQTQEPEVDWSGGGLLPKATVLYEFLASHKDELNLVQNEKIVLLGPGDGEEWVKVRSLLDGIEGLVPRSFICIDPTPPPLPPLPQIVPLTVPPVPSSVASAVEASPPAKLSLTVEDKKPLLPSTSPHPPMLQNKAGQFVRALISFQGAELDELSFAEGDIIHVLGHPVGNSNVDDGWLEGELVPSLFSSSSSSKGSVVVVQHGFFPSMFVKPFEGKLGDPAHWLVRLEEAKSNKSTMPSKHRSVSGGGSQHRSISGRRSDQSRSRQQQKKNHSARQHKPRLSHIFPAPQTASPPTSSHREGDECPSRNSSTSVDAVCSSPGIVLVHDSSPQPSSNVASTSTWIPSHDTNDLDLRIAEV